MSKKLLRRLLPNPRKIREHRLLTWMGSSLHHPRLWHVSCEGVARGAAIGLFFGLLVPLGQIPLAAAAAIVLHANLPTAVLSTLVTNPFTFAPIYYFAYRFGLFLMGADSSATSNADAFGAEPEQITSWLEAWSNDLVRLGKPLYTGLIALACGSAALSYFGISGLWRAFTAREWRQRHLRRNRPNNQK